MPRILSYHLMRALLMTIAALAAAPALAQDDPPAGANQMCPVMTEEPATTEYFAEYKGVKVYFCCGKCKAKFAKDPETYIANLPATIREKLMAGGAAAAAVAPAIPAKAEAPVPGEIVPAAAAMSADQAALTKLLFATDNEQAFLARRAIRMTLVPRPPLPPEAPAEVGNEIDRFLLASWAKAGLPEAKSPPALASDPVFLRRVYLDVIGAAPTRAEAERFLKSTDPEKRAKLVDELLARNADYAAHWTPFWEDALGSADTALQGGVPTRGSYRDWIYGNFRANKPFDVMVAELIDPSMPGHKAATTANANGKDSVISYIRNETHTDTLQSAAAVGQVFLGTGMKCASCHSHFENQEWPQTRFLGFAGMFAPKDLEVIRCEKKMGTIAAAKFPFDLPGAPTDVPPELDGRLRRAAQLLTDPTNPRFAKAIVNRLWKRYLGLGLFEPVDDFRLDRPPSEPELLDWLAYDFMEHGYDLKHTIRLILTSRAYQREYDAALEDHFDVSKPTLARHYRSPTLRRLTAEQLIDSLKVATTGKLDPKARLYKSKTSTALSRSLGKPASRNEISTGRPDDVAVVQSLELLNGEEFHGLVYAGPLLGELAKLEPDAAVEGLYRAVLTRGPTERERGIAVEYLRSAIDRASAAPAEPHEAVLIDDDLPAGAMPTGEWKWVAAADGPVFSGGRSHTQATEGKRAQHYYTGAAETQAAGPRDTLYVHIYLDAKDPPKEIMVQWNDGVAASDGGWGHRAFWGEDVIPYGEAGTASRRAMGPLPRAGEWARLEIPAGEVGFTGGELRISGMAFDQEGGTVHWDKAGIIQRPEDPAATALGDLFWVLAAGPEFQYIR